MVRCASLKSNLGHLEAAAAAAGLSSLVAGPLLASVVAVNAQLRRLVFELALPVFATIATHATGVCDCGVLCFYMGGYNGQNLRLNLSNIYRKSFSNVSSI